MKIYSYNPGSKGARALAEALGVKIIKHGGKPIRVRGVVINWGASRINRELVDYDILNAPAAVAKASNKLETFKALLNDGVATPQWSTNKADALRWIEEGHAVVCREKLTGHSGEGIVIAEKAEQIVDAPLYTRYVKKKEEYRIHVFRGEAFFVQRKARKMDVPAEEVNWKVRNLAGGFIFAHQNVEVDDVARNEAVAAVAALSLDFGAVDIIRGSDGKFYVLEVNTACGIEGTTLEKYVEKFQQFQ